MKGTIPACELPCRAFRLTYKGLVAEPAANQDPPIKSPLLPQGFWWSRDFLLRGLLPCGALLVLCVPARRWRRAKRLKAD